MRYARAVVNTLDGVERRVIVSPDQGATWWDVRAGVAEDARRRGATDAAARRLAHAIAPPSMSECLAGGDRFHEAVDTVLHLRPELASVVTPVLGNAIDPASYRDFMVFEEHFSFGYRWQGKQVPDVMYELPISYAGDPRSFIGPGEDIPWPAYSHRLDYELELGIVISRPGRNLTPDSALEHVLGLTILNDVSGPRHPGGRDDRGPWPLQGQALRLRDRAGDHHARRTSVQPSHARASTTRSCATRRATRWCGRSPRWSPGLPRVRNSLPEACSGREPATGGQRSRSTECSTQAT